ncbi:MAG: HEAT repeat domain-containing protein, partial [Opitutales bacterium]
LLEKFVSKLVDPDVEIRRQVSEMLPRLSYGLFRSNMQIVEINGRKVYRSVAQSLSPAIASIAQRSFLDSDPIVRQNMLKYFYTLRISIPPLTLERLLGDEDRGVRMAALDRVTSLPPHNAVFLKLRELASHEDAGVRQKVASIARSSSHPLARQILRSLRNDKDPYVMALAVISLARLGEVQPDAMVAKVREFLLGTTSTSNQVVSLVYSISAFKRDQARETFRALTEHDSSNIRRIGWERYLNYDNAMSQPKLWLPALDDRNKNIRESIASLVLSRAGAFTSQVMNALTESPHDDVRRFAANCLTLVPASVSEEFAFDLLIDEKLEVRAAAIKSIGIRRPKNWEVIMERSLLDDHFIIQRTALEALLNAPAQGVPLLVSFAQKNANSPITGAIRVALARRNIVIP